MWLAWWMVAGLLVGGANGVSAQDKLGRLVDKGFPPQVCSCI